MAGKLIASRKAGDNWTWFADYLNAVSDWTLVCEVGRRCQVGMGIFFLGEPRGEKIRFTERVQITTIGAGAIHVRVVDGRGPCRVNLYQGNVVGIPLPVPGQAEAAELATPGSEPASQIQSPEQLAAIQRYNEACRSLMAVWPADTFPGMPPGSEDEPGDTLS